METPPTYKILKDERVIGKTLTMHDARYLLVSNKNNDNSASLWEIRDTEGKLKYTTKWSVKY